MDKNDLELVEALLRLIASAAECGNCGARIILEGPHDLTRCPACSREFEPSAKAALDRLRERALYLRTKAGEK